MAKNRFMELFWLARQLDLGNLGKSAVGQVWLGKTGEICWGTGLAS